MRSILAVFLLLSQSASTIQEQVVRIGEGTPVEVRLTSKEKLRGRMQAITSDSFEVQMANGSQLTTRTVAFTEVQSIKAKERVSTTTRVFKGIGIFVVVFTVVMAIAYHGRLD